jgi:hypothetical protein
LLLVERMTAGILTSDGRTLSAETSNLKTPLFLTRRLYRRTAWWKSRRRRLFESMVLSKPPSEWLDAQIQVSRAPVEIAV